MQKEEINEYKKLGINVVVIGNEERERSKYCNQCENFKIIDAYESGRNTAVCLEVKAVIANRLEMRECSCIYKPLYCPHLGRNLNEDEKNVAKLSLEWAKMAMK